MVHFSCWRRLDLPFFLDPLEGTETQLYLQLIELADFGKYGEGSAVARDLRQHPDLWSAVLLTNEQAGYILTSSEHFELQKRAYEDWEADSVEVFTGKKHKIFCKQALI